MATFHIITDGILINPVDSFLMIMAKYYIFPLAVNLSAALLIFIAGIFIRNWKKEQDFRVDNLKDYDKLSITQAVTKLIDKIV